MSDSGVGVGDLASDKPEKKIIAKIRSKINNVFFII
jgi:hypothetical protein